jgi:hypothetical protein
LGEVSTVAAGGVNERGLDGDAGVEHMIVLDWAPGNLQDLNIPAHAEALREGGATFLTDAFRATGAIAADNRITRITQFDECPGGSTGRKLLLSVEYETPGPHADLFVKFSRDFDDPLRDRGKVQMESEVGFAALSRDPNFPIAVPECFYADYDPESGTGILIVQRIAFGVSGVERHYDKCLDYEVPRPLEHYQAIIRALARLAGTQKAGRLSQEVAHQFPFDPGKLAVAVKTPYTPDQLRNRVKRYGEFAEKFPQLSPANIATPEFVKRLMEEVPRFPEHEAAMMRFLNSKPEFVALCHWNANIDNAWFWRDARGGLQCGLMDWGHVSQMNVAMALWGCLSAAEIEIWDNHLDDLLALFTRELTASGGPALDIAQLKFHLHIYVALMGLAWLLDPATHIPKQIADLDKVKDIRDPRIAGNEFLRTQLHMMTVFLNLWQREDFGSLPDRFIAQALK